MKKITLTLFSILFVGFITMTSCVDTQADEIYSEIIPEKGNNGYAGGGDELTLPG